MAELSVKDELQSRSALIWLAAALDDVVRRADDLKQGATATTPAFTFGARAGACCSCTGASDARGAGLYFRGVGAGAGPAQRTPATFGAAAPTPAPAPKPAFTFGAGAPAPAPAPAVPRRPFPLDRARPHRGIPAGGPARSARRRRRLPRATTYSLSTCAYRVSTEASRSMQTASASSTPRACFHAPSRGGLSRTTLPAASRRSGPRRGCRDFLRPTIAGRYRRMARSISRRARESARCHPTSNKAS